MAAEPVTKITIHSPLRFGQARRVFAQLFQQAERPDVVVCGSGTRAQGLIVEANAAGLQVPERFAVAGFGNASVVSERRPFITTVEIDGTQIVLEVDAAIQGHVAGVKPERRSINVGFRIIGRESAWCAEKW